MVLAATICPRFLVGFVLSVSARSGPLPLKCKYAVENTAHARVGRFKLLVWYVFGFSLSLKIIPLYRGSAMSKHAYNNNPDKLVIFAGNIVSVDFVSVVEYSMLWLYIVS